MVRLAGMATSQGPQRANGSGNPLCRRRRNLGRTDTSAGGGSLLRPVNGLLLARYALLVVLTAFIPIPWVDSWAERQLRRRLTRRIAADRGLTLAEDVVVVLADPPAGSCLGLVVAALKWPFKKVLRTFFIVIFWKGAVDVYLEVVHRGLMLDDAIARGALPSRAAQVREAMDRTLASVDVRLLERRVAGVFREPTHRLNRVVWDAAKAARARPPGAKRVAYVSALAEKAGLGSVFEATAGRLAGLVHEVGLVPELLHWFAAELAGASPTPYLPAAALVPSTQEGE